MDPDDKFPQNAEEYLRQSQTIRTKAYETALQNFQKLVLEMKDYPCHIHSFHIKGTKRTRQSLFESVINPALGAKTFSKILNEINIAADKLQRLDIFQYPIYIEFDCSKDPLAQPDAIDVILSVEEKSRFWIKTGTEIGNDSGSANISLNIRNVFGGAETLEAFMSASTQTSHVFEFCLAKPINGNPDSKIDITAFSLTRNNQNFSSHDEILRGVALRWRGLSRLGFHELSYGSTWRQVCNIAQQATLSIRESAGHSLKSSLTHNFIRDRRDDIMLPSRGYYLRLFQEIAGLGGDVCFLKTETESQLNFPLGKGFILSTSLRNGLLFQTDGQKSKISDRFFLGGAQSIRGFKLNGIGPREDKKDSLGGDIYVAGGLSLFTPLPKLHQHPVKGHLFLNGGSLLQFNPSQPLLKSIKGLSKAPSVSAGIGIVYRSSILRLEVNFCLPLLATTTDKLQKGLQLGLGFNFW